MTDRKTYNREYYLKNKDRINAQNSAYARTPRGRQIKNQASREWRKNHPDKCREMARNWYRQNPDKEKEYRHRGNAKVKLEVLSHYANGSPVCACCGEKQIDFLTIDDIYGTVHRTLARGGVAFYRWLKHQGYPQGFQVLCYNCNCAKGFCGRCPHTIAQMPVMVYGR